MSHESVPVTVQILDSEYRVSCPEHEREALLQAALHLNDKMREIRDSGKALGAERIAVMAALNVCYELLTCRLENARLDASTAERLKNLLGKVENALSKSAEIEV